MDVTTDNLLKIPLNTETYNFCDWEIVYRKSHILKSICANKNECKLGDENCCELCFYGLTIQLPHLPDMVFPKNIISLTHKNGCRLEFNALDALRSINATQNGIQVSCANEWQESRPKQLLEEKVKPFDWTFSTEYDGTVNGGFRVEPTSQKIDIFKLMKKEPMLFYNELTLYEDELHDNGISACTVKIRVMPSGFFILLRYFLRIDNVMIRMNDTRFHFEIENNYILKEYTTKEAKIESLKHVPPALFTRPSEIESHLPVLVKTAQKLIFKGASEINNDSIVSQ